MSVAGVVLLADRIGAIVGTRWHEVSWRDGEPLEPAVAALAATLGRVRRVQVAVGLAHLHVQQVTLPPVPRDDRRRMLALDPSRWFAVAADAALAVALAPGDRVAFGTESAWLERWVTALDAWAPVVAVEPAPVAEARQLAGAGARDGTYALPAGDGEHGRLVLDAGTISLVRRMPAAVAAQAEAPVAAPALPSDLPDAARAALGVARAPRDDGETLLVSSALALRFRRTAQRRLVTALAAAVAAVLLAAWSLADARERRLAWLEAEAARLRPSAAPALAQVDSAARLARERALVDAADATHTPVLDPLARLGERLPTTAVAQRITVTGRHWEVSGSAPAAAAVLTALAAERTFTDVRLLAPSTRVPGGGPARETFSIGFDVR